MKNFIKRIQRYFTSPVPHLRLVPAANVWEYKLLIKREIIEWSCIRDCFTEASNDEYYL